LLVFFPLLLLLLLLQVKKVTLHDVRRMGEKAPTVSAAVSRLIL
jgi:hypothetical protein